MQDIDQRDRELLGALQGDIPLSATPYALIGQSIDMSEKEVIKRAERLKRDGLIKHIAAHFDTRALGYRSNEPKYLEQAFWNMHVEQPGRDGSPQ